MRRPAVFFDRDNTLIASDGYLGDPTKVALIPGAADAVVRARRLGYATVIFSNQSGVARGMFGEDAVHAVNSRLDELLAEQNAAAVIDRHEFCPFHPEGTVDQYARESDLRKPAPGMIHQAAEKLALDLSRSWVIGDAPRDIEAGKAAGCRTILFQDPNLPASPAASATPLVLPDHYVQSLKDAIDIIERADSHAPTQPAAPVATMSMGALPTPAVDLQRLESLLEQILQELRKPPATVPPQAPQSPIAPSSGEPHFSITKMLAGVVQVLALAAFAIAYFKDNSSQMFLAFMLQIFTIALLIMGRQR